MANILFLAIIWNINETLQRLLQNLIKKNSLQKKLNSPTPGAFTSIYMTKDKANWAIQTLTCVSKLISTVYYYTELLKILN